MKTLTITIRNLLAIPLALGLPFGTLHAAPQYIITDLGTLGGIYSNGAAINESGQIVGYSHFAANSALHPFLWQSGVNLDLGTLGGTHAMALGINSAGQVIGNSQITGDAASRGFVWNVNAMSSLSTLGGTRSRATAINDNGVMSGAASVTGDTSEHGVIWPTSLVTSPTDLGTLGGSNSQGNDININGQVVGYAENASGLTHAIRWVAPYDAASRLDLGTLGGSYSEAYGINALGHITGISSNANDAQFRGFIWQSGQGMVDLGTLTATSTHTAGLDINSNDDVVGYSTTASGVTKRAIIRKTGTTLADLNGLILPNTGWALSEARAINDAGQIVGIGTLTKVDTVNNLNRVEPHAFLLTPDTVKPTITCPATITTTGAQPIGIGTAIAQDNLDTAPAITNNRPTPFPNGDTTVVWTATDANGNAATCTQLVTVGGDNTPPVVSVAIAPVSPSASGWYLVSPSVTWTVTDAQSAISSRVGCTNVPAVANTAPAGQTFSCIATSAGGTSTPVVTSVIKVDTVAPVLVGVPAAFTQQASSPTGATVNYTLPTATDTFSGVNGVVSCLPASGATLPIGANTITCSATDNAGNSKSASFVVTVLAAPDTTPPVITPTVTGTMGQNGWFIGPVTVSWSATDAQSAITSPACPSVVISTNGIGQTRACTATSAGGTATVNTQLINIDTLAPSFTCPAAVTLISPATVTTPTATDNLSAAVVTRTPAGTLPLGTTSVTWIARDQAGNTTPSTCIQQVTVNAPVTETINVPASTAICKVKSSTSGEWSVRGTSTVSTNNRIQLYLTSTVPVDLTSNRLGTSVQVSAGAWSFSAKPGPACKTPISLRSTVGTIKENIVVNVQ
ncbi:HYR domain-containing protein [Crenothrix sp.]|uniref:HYR domain-containing protein n=1 Tax=Crenothrix sp. TaxID=3100433 RepID=UPI00374D6B47